MALPSVLLLHACRALLHLTHGTLTQGMFRTVACGCGAGDSGTMILALEDGLICCGVSSMWLESEFLPWAAAWEMIALLLKGFLDVRCKWVSKENANVKYFPEKAAAFHPLKEVLAETYRLNLDLFQVEQCCFWGLCIMWTVLTVMQMYQQVEEKHK